MRLNILRSGPALVALALSACSPATPPVAFEPVSLEASYRLLFNDALVGNALFVLEIHPDGRYRIDAFTTPAGQMRRAAGHEVLESSQGTIDSGGVRPLRFDLSVMADGQVEWHRLVFDWDRGVQRIADPNSERTVALLPGTQDRLSYLLTAHRLAATNAESLELRIASIGATEKTQLLLAGPEPIDVPLGHFETIAVRRVTSEPNEIRALWFEAAVGPLPLRVVHGWVGNTVDMQLESLTRRPDRPR